MAEIRNGTCKRCGIVRIQRPGTNHLMHLVLSVLTGGLWLAIWVLAVMLPSQWRCDSCGSVAQV